METRTIPFRERLTCSVDDAHDRTGLSRATLYRLINEGRLEVIKVGARTLVKVPSLLKLIEPEIKGESEAA